ncbi:putative FBD domain, leucine-rich repeat domain superfamily, F-box-like domain superfamily [Helianthus annuus]|nr:putative FBD domain, leucine-rich repeat domain superfamily, F-box-like domain superfamily [Helianthus annuus]KAJ0701453.1 putative FBD domain, leucine-rich repeat domain superfamily, F-box-like domain superfamily [Helianthus annuus]
MKAKRPTKAQRLSSTTINTLPQTIIENILCLLPIQEAARTSILSREWRYKWTTIPKLDFCSSTVPEIRTQENQTSHEEWARRIMERRRKLFNAIHQVLLMHQGPIHEFSFNLIADCYCFELDPIIFHLSRNHAVKKLKLAFNYHMFPYKLPLCAFSMHQLTDLYLHNVVIDHQPIFSGFGSLRSLCLYYVKISTKALLHLLSNCPSLKRFSLLGSICDKDCTIIELFDCLHVIEDLTIYGDTPELIAEGIGDDNETWFGILEKYSDVRLEHLQELEIHRFRNLEHEMELVTVILARSPKLKKVIIHSLVEKDEESDMLKILLQASRASPVEIVVRSMID